MRKIRKFNQKIKERIASAAEFPIECVSGVPVIEIKGRNEAYVSGCSRILEYTPQTVMFDAGHYNIKIEGEKMLLSDFTAGCMCVSGNILKIDLETGED